MPAAAPAAIPAAGPVEPSADGGAVPLESVFATILRMQGFPCLVSLGRNAPVAAPQEHRADGVRFILGLKAPLPVMHLVSILWRLRQSSFACAAVFTAGSAPDTGYGERLHVGADQSLIKIERRFRRGASAAAENRLAAAVVKIPAGAHPPPELSRYSPWMLIRRTLADGGAINSVNIPLHGTLAEADALHDIVQTLPAPALGQLARLLGLVSVAPGCYATADCRVDPQAVLRGPLVISHGTQIGPRDICIGPAWLRANVGGNAARPRPRNQLITAALNSPNAPPEQPTQVIIGPGYFSGPRTRPKPFYESCKRLFDATVAAVAIACLLPIGLVAAAAVKLQDGGPVFFTHKREGLHGKPFGCMKFRTMVMNAEEVKQKLRAINQVDGPQFKLERDPRITVVGRILRKTNVDELPQLINVLLGQMSLVGPRPSPFEENQMCPPWREARLSVKPGITGLWQVSRSRQRGPADFQEWILYDTQYVERRNFLLDIRILMLTVKEILGKGQ